LRRWGRQRKCQPFSAHTHTNTNASSNSPNSGTDTNPGPDTDSDSGTDTNSGPDSDADSGPDSDADSGTDTDADSDTNSNSGACDLDRVAGYTGNGVNFSRIHTTVFRVGNILRRQQPGSDCFGPVEFL
jgi:hypothetical protein